MKLQRTKRIILKEPTWGSVHNFLLDTLPFKYIIRSFVSNNFLRAFIILMVFLMLILCFNFLSVNISFTVCSRVFLGFHCSSSKSLKLITAD